MNNKYSSLRVGVFYDGNFLLHASNYYNYVHSRKSRISLCGLQSFIRNRLALEEGCDPGICKIVESHYFRGRISAAEAAQRGNQLYNDRVFEDILMAEGIQTHYLPLRSYLGRKEERGIDVWLSLEVLEYVLRDRIDTAVLIISDTDYVPLMRKLSSLGIRVMLLSWEFDYVNDDGVKVVTKTSHELLQLASYPVAMHDIIEEGLESGDPAVLGIFVEGDGMRPELKSSNEQEVHTSEILSIKSGFGFVKYPNNNLFFHCMDVIGDFEELRAGDTVEFTIDKNQQGQHVAKNVRKIDPAEGVVEADMENHQEIANPE